MEKRIHVELTKRELEIIRDLVVIEIEEVDDPTDKYYEELNDIADSMAWDIKKFENIPDANNLVMLNVKECTDHIETLFGALLDVMDRVKKDLQECLENERPNTEDLLFLTSYYSRLEDILFYFNDLQVVDMYELGY